MTSLTMWRIHISQIGCAQTLPGYGHAKRCDIEPMLCYLWTREHVGSGTLTPDPHNTLNSNAYSDIWPAAGS